MTMHSPHPDTHTHGLHDGCPLCAEHAEHPMQSLDEENLRRMIALALRPDRLDVARSDLERVASAKVLTVLEQAGALYRADPNAVIHFLVWYSGGRSLRAEPAAAPE